MHTLNEKALQKLAEVHEYEAKQYLKVVNRIKKLGLEQHTSHAVIQLAESGAVLARN